MLAAIDLEQFYSSSEADRLAAVAPLLAHRGVEGGAGLEKDLFEALKAFAPLGLHGQYDYEVGPAGGEPWRGAISRCTSDLPTAP